ncbi:nuclear transport factor 2 family protein [Fibrella forsythiae]|uniref:Nuclear transport factor 2 family protein n=1 Tax=Fibrella forsythiae TaxID=2817061 RepID=A0ABS3JMV8_9BACT|nr:nuclear transport factor 2 family protein [Fibrella forsythiae]MBO0951350.1 nuclear transport factor 2 family protein [Fibrella forsythiae]
MYRLLLVFCLLTTTFCLAQSPQHKLLRSLDRQRFDALVQKDTLALGQLLANDLLYTHSSGAVETKREFIHSIAVGRWNYQSIDTDSVTVRFYGPVAILTGRARVTLLIADKPTPVTMMYTDVWHNTAKPKRRRTIAKWQLVSWAAARLPTT